MDAVIHDLLSVDTVFLLQIRVEPSFNILNDGPPASMEHYVSRGIAGGTSHVPVVIVDKVTKTGCVSNGKAETDTVLLNVYIVKGGGGVFSVGNGRV